MTLVPFIALAASSPSFYIRFDSTPYHVTGTGSKATTACLVFNDVHRLTGTIQSGQGGNVTAHNDNGTIADDYILSFSKTLGTFVGHWMCNGERVDIQGFDVQPMGPPHEVTSMIFKTAAGEVLAGLTKGGTWKPPPCSNARNQSSCDGISACTWCSSPDHVHNLCFESRKTPSDWQCEHTYRSA